MVGGVSGTGLQGRRGSARVWIVLRNWALGAGDKGGWASAFRQSRVLDGGGMCAVWVCSGCSVHGRAPSVSWERGYIARSMTWGVRWWACLSSSVPWMRAGVRGLVSAILAICDKALTWVEVWSGGGDSFVELKWGLLVGSVLGLMANYPIEYICCLLCFL